jgi:mannose-1-phosphate guanylyltransferase
MSNEHIFPVTAVLEHTYADEHPNLFAVIMAGGSGTRLWPLSRRHLPKQFLDFFGDGTMICKTVDRLKGLVRDENIIIVTNASGRKLVRKQLPQIPKKNIIVEPVARNTAPCIALATAFIRKRNPNGVMCVLPSDHVIQNVSRFQETLRAAVEVAERTSALVTIGMKPTRPETGYGYIQAEDTNPEITTSIKVRFGVNAHKVKTFAEKPDIETAQRFLESGDFLWNSGVFVWHVNAITREFERSMPQLYLDMQTIQNAVGTRTEKKIIENVYSWTHSISIDYGVMEKADSVYVLEGDFDWSDAGSWDEIMKFRDHNLEREENRNLLLHDSPNTLVFKPKHKTIAIIGIEDAIVVETADALLICKRGRSQDVKNIVDVLKRKEMEQYI